MKEIRVIGAHQRSGPCEVKKCAGTHAVAEGIMRRNATHRLISIWWVTPTYVHQVEREQRREIAACEECARVWAKKNGVEMPEVTS